MQRVYLLLGIICICVMLVCAGCDLSTGPDSVGVNWQMVNYFWNMAEDELGITRFNPGKVIWKAYDGPFECEDGLSHGCFNTNGTIKYNVNTPGVIKHEACHAIKYYSHMKDWREGCYSSSETWPQ